MKKILVVTVLLAVLLSGCTLMTQDQKDWVVMKADRSEAFIKLLDEGKTTREQEQSWIKSQNESWKLWAEKVNYGLAAPSWSVKTDPTTGGTN